MRVIVWGINYWPEEVGIAPYNTGLCEYLAKAGHEVEMVTTFAYYPGWEKNAEDRGRLYRSDLINGVRVRRCWHYVPRRPSGMGRILHEASFVKTSLLRVLMLKRADVMVVVSPPLLLGAAAWLAGKVKGTRHVLHIQDLQPDAALGLGMLEQGWFVGMLRRLERFNYRTAACVSVISEGMLRMLKERGVERLVYFPNWVGEKKGEGERGVFRARHGIGEEEFLMVYSGNIGMKQGLDLIVEAAVRVKELRLVVCGDGAARARIEELIAARGAGNVTMLPLQAEEDYRRMMADADVCVISQRAGGGAAFFPSKLLSCSAMGKPVLAVADEVSELARVVTKEGLGAWSVPEVERVVEAMRELLGSRGKLGEWGGNGKVFAGRFEEGRVLGEFCEMLKGISNMKE